MAITRSGVFNDNSTIGLFEYGTNAFGRLSITGPSVLDLQSGAAQVDTGIGIFDNGVGELSISSGGTLNISAPTGVNAVFVGILGGSGTADIDNGTLAVDGLTSSGVQVGSGTGSVGKLTLRNGGTTLQTSEGTSYLSVGLRDGLGEAVIDASTYQLQSAESAAVYIGDQGGSGVGTVRNGGRLELDSDTSAVLDIGWNGGTGAMYVASEAQVQITSNGPNIAGGTIGLGGAEAAEGLLKINNGGLVNIRSTQSGWAFLSVGQATGGDGNLVLESGGSLSLHALGSGSAALNIGRDAGTGNVTLTDSSLSLRSETASTQLRIGDGGTSAGGVGHLEASGSNISLHGDTAFLMVGPDSGVRGTLTLREDTTVSLTATSGNRFDAYFGIGYRADTSASVEMLDATSVTGVGLTEIGTDPLNRADIQNAGVQRSGSARLTLQDSALLQSDLVVVGDGGYLRLYGGSIVADQIDIFGVLFVKSTTPFALNGQVLVESAVISVTLDNPGGMALNAPLSHSGGTVTLAERVSFVINIDNGLKIEKGDRFRLLETELGDLTIRNGTTFAVFEPHESRRTFFDTAIVIGHDADSDFVDFYAMNDLRGRERSFIDLGALGLNSATVAVLDEGNKRYVADDGVSQVHFESPYELRATAGADTITIHEGYRKIMHAGDGDDTMISVMGYHELFGGDGHDTLDYSGAIQSIEVYLNADKVRAVKPQFQGASNDNVYGFESVIGTQFDDRLVGNSAGNTLTGGDGNDVLKGKGGADTFFGGLGDDRLRGDDGIDTMSGGAGSDVLLGLAGNDLLQGDDGDDFIYGGRDADHILGGSGADRLRGNVGGDTLHGGEGADDLRGGGNGDQLNGDADDDYLLGEGGGDILDGGAGNDTLIGGFGGGILDGLRDTFVYRGTAHGAGGFDRIRDFENGIDRVDLTAFNFADFATVHALAVDTGADMRINLGSGDVIYFDAFSVAQFTADDVLI